MQTGITNWIFWFAIACLCIYKLWMASAMPFFVPMFYPEDDTWFFKKALSISAGGWFGDAYNSHTLIKLPMYPLFLSGIASLGIHPKLALDLLYIAASLIFVLAIRNALHNRLALFLGFAIILLNPITLSDYWVTLLRLNLFTPLVLVYVSSLIALIAQANKDQPEFSLLWTLICAISLTLAWFTREEAIWMISGLAPMVLVTFSLFIRKRLRIQILVFWLMIIIMPYLPGQYFSSINQDKYGFNGVIDTRAPEFSRAFNAILSLNTANDTSVHYMTPKTRDKLEIISEDTRQLVHRMLDEKSGYYKHYGQNINGNHASWEIRLAMARNGYYADPGKTEVAYRKIANDIETYCASTPGACRSMYVSGVLVKPASLKRVIDEVKRSSTELLELSYFEPATRTREIELKKEHYYRGDSLFEYTVNRYFNTNTSWDPALDQRFNMPYIERRKNKKIESNYRYFKKIFYGLAILAGLGLVIAMLSRQKAPKLTGLLLVGTFSGSYSVFMLISLFAVPGFDRLLAISSITLIILVAYFFAFFIQTGIDVLIPFPGKKQAKR